MKIKGKSNNFLRFTYHNDHNEKCQTQTDLDNNFILLNIDPSEEIHIESVQPDTVMPKIADMEKQETLLKMLYKFYEEQNPNNNFSVEEKIDKILRILCEMGEDEK